MLIEWSDLEPGDKLCITQEFKRFIENNDLWHNKKWIYFVYLTIQEISFYKEYFRVRFVEQCGEWRISNNNIYSYYNMTDIPVFEIYELKQDT